MIYSALSVLFVAAAPISELRGAIPLALSLHMSPVAAYLLAVVGNALPILPLLLFLKYGSAWAMEHSPIVKKILEKVFARTRTKHGAKFAQFGFWPLALFVAVPIPLTGAWTGAIIAYLIDMPIKKAFFAILIGVLIAGVLVEAAALGVIKLF